MRKTEEIIFYVIFRKGIADKNRLPLTHVISTLREIDFMIREVGKKVQQESGVENPDGDFGVQLLAGSTGIAFGKGSVKAASAITRDIKNGTETLTRIIQTTNVIEKRKPISIDDYRAPVVRRLANISDIQVEDKTELGMQLVAHGKIAERGKFSESGIHAIQRMGAAPDFAVESVTLFGKLRQLLDRSRVGKEDDIWGELLEENGNRWNIKFRPHHLTKVKDLFTKQVIASGNAIYFKTKNPRLDVTEIDEDKERDYVAAFDRFSEEYGEVFGDRDPDQILKDIRG
jgi:hypothetical protein